MAYIPPPLDRPPYFTPEISMRKVRRFVLSDILLIGAAVGLVGFLVALITAIVTAGG